MPPPTSRPLNAPERAKLALTADLVKADVVTDAMIGLINAQIRAMTYPQGMHMAKRLGDYFQPIDEPNDPKLLPPSKDRLPCPPNADSTAATTPPTTSTATRPGRPCRAPAPAGGSRSRSPATTAGRVPKA